VAERTIITVPRFGQNQFNTGNAVVVAEALGRAQQDRRRGRRRAEQELSKITSVRAVASVRGAFQRGGGGGGGGGTNVDLIAVGNDYVQLANWLKPILEASQANPGLSRPRLDYEPTSPRLSVQIDRDKAASLGISAQSIGRALETMFGSRQVTTYIKNGQEYDVILQTALEQRRSVEDLNRCRCAPTPAPWCRCRRW
jgi:multidrug efflux pump